jgi:hypothetical protein
MHFTVVPRNCLASAASDRSLSERISVPVPPQNGHVVDTTTIPAESFFTRGILVSIHACGTLSKHASQRNGCVKGARRSRSMIS